MEKLSMLISLLLVVFAITACGGATTKEQKWSKPERVLEGCDGVMSNSQQCQKNPNNQQMMIQIERK